MLDTSGPEANYGPRSASIDLRSMRTLLENISSYRGQALAAETSVTYGGFQSSRSQIWAANDGINRSLGELERCGERVRNFVELPELVDKIVLVGRCRASGQGGGFPQRSNSFSDRDYQISLALFQHEFCQGSSEAGNALVEFLNLPQEADVAEYQKFLKKAE